MYVMQPFSIDAAAPQAYQYPTPGFVIFRHLDMRDFIPVQQLGNAAFPDMAYPDTYWCSLLSEQTDTICLGCHDGASGALLGFITVAPDARAFLAAQQSAAGGVSVLYEYFGKCSYITSLCVHPGYRRLGFGRQLVARAIAVLRALPQPSSLLFLHVADDNAGALRFYTRTGFSTYSTIPGYYQTRTGNSQGLSDTALVLALSLCGEQPPKASPQPAAESSLLGRTFNFVSSMRPAFRSARFGC